MDRNMMWQRAAMRSAITRSATTRSATTRSATTRTEAWARLAHGAWWARRALAVCAVPALMLLSAEACSSTFFQLDPTANGSSPAAKPPETPSSKPETKPATRPAQKPDTKPAAPPPPKPPAKAAAASTEKPPEKPPERTAPKPAPVAPTRSSVVSAPVVAADAEGSAPLSPLFSLPEPSAAASDSAGVARLATLAMAWHTIAMHHPAVSDRGDQWDGAVARGLLAVRSATTTDALREAYAAIVGTLGDPLTRVETVNGAPPAGAPGATSAALSLVTLPDSTAVLTMPASNAYRDADRATVGRLIALDAPQIVIDLRSAERAASMENSEGADVLAAERLLEETGLVSALITAPLPMPRTRVRRFGSQGPLLVDRAGASTLIGTSAIMSGWAEQDRGTIAATGARAPRIAFIVNDQSAMPMSFAALALDGRALVIAEGAASDQSLAPSVVMPLAPGLGLRVRTGDVVAPNGAVGFRADTIVAAIPRQGDVDASARAALRLLRMLGTARAATPTVQRLGMRRATFPAGSAAYANDTVPYPYMGARVMAGFRIWGVMRSSHAHRDSYDDDIDAVFLRTLPRIEAADNRTRYADALRDFVTSFDDSQVALRGASSEALLGPATATFRARDIDGHVIVTTSAASEAPPVGAEITSVDGYPMPAWLLEHKRDVAASNEWTRRRDLLLRMQRGPAGPAPYRIREAAGPERAAQFARVVARADVVQSAVQNGAVDASMIAQRSSPVTSRPAADIAYLDLDRMDSTQVRTALAAATDARAVVLDLRGSARAWQTVLARVTSNPEYTTARVVQRTVSAPCMAVSVRDIARECPDERTTIPVMVRSDTSGHYRGRIVALIDERTQGAAEQLAIALDAGTRATLIGSATAGAAADTTSQVLAGGLRLSYPVDEIRRADGGQVHRTGVAPLIEVQPTVRGIRSGKDEALDRALLLLQPTAGDSRRRR